MADRHDVVSDPFTAQFIRMRAAKLCRRADFSPSDRADLEQGMHMHLLEKAHLFNPTRGNVEAFVTHLVKSWIRMELRFRGRSKRLGNLMTVSLERTFIDVDGQKEPLDHVIHPLDQQRRTSRLPPCPLDRIEVADAVRYAFGRLGSEEQELLVYVSEHGVAGAAREWSRRSKKKVSRRHIDARVARMRSRFEDAGLGCE